MHCVTIYTTLFLCMKNCIAAFAIWNVKWVMRYEVQDTRYKIQDTRYKFQVSRISDFRWPLFYFNDCLIVNIHSEFLNQTLCKLLKHLYSLFLSSHIRYEILLHILARYS